MPQFSAESLKQLATCHPELQVLFHEVIKHFDCKILEGYRNEADQNKAFAAGNSKLKFPNGRHNKLPSLALDAVPYPVPPWNKNIDFIYFGGIVMGIASQLKANGIMKHDLRYGGDFNSNDRVSDSTFADNVHFELVV